MEIKGFMKKGLEESTVKLEMDPETCKTIISALKCAFGMSDFAVACDMCDLARALDKILAGDDSNGAESKRLKRRDCAINEIDAEDDRLQSKASTNEWLASITRTIQINDEL